jgi:type IV fimbrial biogenesis protein FimT
MKINMVCNSGSQRGFSLIEIIVVVAILAVSAGVAIPVYIGMKPSIRLSGATRQIMGDLMWARMQAISQNNEFKIFFLDNHRYTILDDDDNDGTIDSGELTVTKDIHDEHYDVTLSWTAEPIFHPRGNASPAATVTITNPSGTKTVTIAMTGRVKIE